MIAFVYPGQGAEVPGMGLWLEVDHRDQLTLIMAGGAAGGVDAIQLLRRGGPDWGRTSVVQPLLVSVCVATTAVLRRKGVVPAVAAGHSVGEVAAWHAAGALQDVYAIALAGARGRAMEGVAEGGMVAVDGEANRDAALAAGAAAGVCVVAAHNRPERWVLSGDPAGLAAAAAAAPVVPVPVTGPWHSPLVAPAVEAMRGVLPHIARSRAQIPVISGATGEPGELDASILAQLAGPVRWVDVLRRLQAMGVTDAVTVGPGKTLRAQLRDTVPGIRVHGTETGKELAATVEALRG